MAFPNLTSDDLVYEGYLSKDQGIERRRMQGKNKAISLSTYDR